MSGILGIVHFDRTPIDSALLQRMMDKTAYRGRDGQRVWLDGAVGLGHAMLHTTDESFREVQPFSGDGHVWIVADARIDGRAELKHKLEAKGCSNIQQATDVELIWQAYQVWGEDCPEHLLGDFAFAIWDSRRQRLFCARDHFGIRPFYYVHQANRLYFSSSLAALRQVPMVSSNLNELCVADFLIFGHNQDEATTIFQDIQRVPPVHSLVFHEQGSQARQYWDIPIKEIHYKRIEDYTGHFLELLDTAVTERIRTNRIALQMSGGTDSTTVAALAVRHLRQHYPDPQMKAFTITVTKLLGDEEGYYAKIMAEHLNIPIDYMPVDDYLPYQRWDKPHYQYSQPFAHPFSASNVDYLQRLDEFAPVSLTGLGGDPLLYPSSIPYLRLLRGFRWLQFTNDIIWHRRLQGSFAGLHFRSALKEALGLSIEWKPIFPDWIAAGFAKQYDLEARFHSLNKPKRTDHPHQRAYQILKLPQWTAMFIQDDENVPYHEARHPFFDIRLIEFCLAIPVYIVCNKKVLRLAVKDILPEPVRTRPKAPLPGSMFHAHLSGKDLQHELDLSLTFVGSRYIDRVIYLRSLEDNIRGVSRDVIDPESALSLEYWLGYQSIVD